MFVEITRRKNSAAEVEAAEAFCLDPLQRCERRQIKH
jgi:hypothetical protein